MACHRCHQPLNSHGLCPHCPSGFSNLAVTTLTRWQKALTVTGWAIAGLFALACGITTASTLLVLHFASGGLTTYLLAGIMLLATTAANVNMCKNAIPSVLIDMLGKEHLMAGLTQTDDRKPLPRAKKWLLALVGFPLALSVGATLGALTYGSIAVLFTKFALLTALSAACPPLAILISAVFAVTTVICLTALMLKSIASLLKTENIGAKIKASFKDLVDTHPDLPRNRGKSPRRIRFERGLTVALTALILPIAAIGLVMTMLACQGHVGALFASIPKLLPAIANVSSYVVSLGLALVGQIPFTLKMAYLFTANLFRKKDEVLAKEPLTVRKIFSTLGHGIMGGFRLLNAVGNGSIAMLGAHNVTTLALAGAGGMVDSYTGTAGEPTPLNEKMDIVAISSRNVSTPLRANLNLPDAPSPAALSSRIGIFKPHISAAREKDYPENIIVARPRHSSVG